MSSPNGAARAADEALVVVRVEDEINQVLTGHTGCSYESPPQARERALDLVRVLLGYTDQELNGTSEWTCPVAGGRRTVWLDPKHDVAGAGESTT